MGEGARFALHLSPFTCRPARGVMKAIGRERINEQQLSNFARLLPLSAP
jgi:hypothetical protein